MEALNFCRQIRKQMDIVTRGGAYAKMLKEHPYVVNAVMLPFAVKFVLPPGGEVIDDPDLRGVDEDTALCLPFPSVALEFVHHRTDGGGVKVVLHCSEMDTHICVTPWLSNGGAGNAIWYPYPPVFIQRKDPIRREAEGISFELAIGDKGIASDPKKYADWQRNSTQALRVLLCFLNALSCSNVTSEKLPARKPSKTLGALPFDEYHVLTIAVPQGTRKGGAQGGHRSPREHLRRGHIRRLQSGSKIWVNAAVINAGVGGKIRKQYALA